MISALRSSLDRRVMVRAHGTHRSNCGKGGSALIFRLHFPPTRNRTEGGWQPGMAKLWPHAHDLPLILPFWHWRQKRRPGKLRRAEGCLVVHKAVYVMRPIARTQPYTCAVLIIENRGQTALQDRRWLAHRRLRSGGGARPSNPSKFPVKWRREHLVAKPYAPRDVET